jgi:hypothetical protein
MIVGRLIGAVIFLAGAAVLVRDVLVWLDTGHWAPLVLGQLWFEIDRSSMTMAELATQRYLSFVLWDPVITSLLACWSFAVLMVVGGTIVSLCRRGPRHLGISRGRN